ncbi:MAG: adaptor protein MecA [Clostridia bacterium]|nr:adaptor protein MecA [Clostridia bacterium]
MKIERVDENKIKVLLDDIEAKEWNVTVKNISENTPEVQKMFWHAIRLAKDSVNFSVDGAKLFVETIPSCESGIGMLITRVCSDKELQRAVENCAYKGKIHRRDLRGETEIREKRRKCIYKFDSFDSVCAGAASLYDRYSGMSALYKMDEEFYLCLVPDGAVSLCEAEIILPEFAEKYKSSQYVHGLLNEHGKVMIKENAVGILNMYFN